MGEVLQFPNKVTCLRCLHVDMFPDGGIYCQLLDRDVDRAERARECNGFEAAEVEW